ncbi:MAG TPA: hypothetical protein VJB35_05170 [Candidatus Nanoarchaeia archaeon]|nr:hypothetical protein [Candidatus Nanoarchaeia archaeon]
MEINKNNFSIIEGIVLSSSFKKTPSGQSFLKLKLEGQDGIQWIRDDGRVKPGERIKIYYKKIFKDETKNIKHEFVKGYDIFDEKNELQYKVFL